jgi:hypothetical protein
MVREKGFEPLWPCGRQLLRLVRLPVPPLPRGKPSPHYTEFCKAHATPTANTAGLTHVRGA